MKIEKINDNQIRCTLTKADLADRELKISELAYGTEKAKSLFRDMVQQASYEFGFEAEDIPLMIEAIPLSQDCIILVITKVDDPEELDTRFSKFAPGNDLDSSEEETEVTSFSGADDVLDLFKRIHDEKLNAGDDSKSNFVSFAESLGTAKSTEEAVISNDAVSPSKTKANDSFNLTKLYSFNNLDTVIRLAYILSGYYYGINSLYKSGSTGEYLLSLSKSNHSPEEFNKICNVLSEYGMSVKYNSASESYLAEHTETIVNDDALQKLALI